MTSPDDDPTQLIPLEEWPVVIPLPPEDHQIPNPEGDRRIAEEMDRYNALQAEGQLYLEEKARVTAGMDLDELNAWCVQMELWNDAVAGGPRHAAST